jgi:hypothetical protein
MARHLQDCDRCDLVVERGPGWLFVRLVSPAAASDGDEPARDDGLAERVWGLLQAHHTQRLVLECDGLDDARGRLAGEIARLSGRLRDEGGTIRVCGLSESARAALAADATVPPLPSFANRSDAVAGRLPTTPPDGSALGSGAGESGDVVAAPGRGGPRPR